MEPPQLAARRMEMEQLRPVSQLEKLIFPLIAAGVIALLIPAVTPLMGMFMLGNFMRESGVVRRLVDMLETLSAMFKYQMSPFPVSINKRRNA